MYLFTGEDFALIFLSINMYTYSQFYFQDSNCYEKYIFPLIWTSPPYRFERDVKWDNYQIFIAYFCFKPS